MGLELSKLRAAGLALPEAPQLLLRLHRLRQPLQVGLRLSLGVLKEGLAHSRRGGGGARPRGAGGHNQRPGPGWPAAVCRGCSRAVVGHAVVPKRVGVLQYAAAVGNLLHGVHHKPHLAQRLPHQRRQLLQPADTHVAQISQGLGVGRPVGGVALKIVRVPLQAAARVLPPLLAVVQAAARLGLLVSVAGVEAACALPVVGPVPATEPAELVAAGRLAGHVHAPRQLLDGPLALGARLRVGQDPVHIAALGARLQLPRPQDAARQRAVGLRPARPAQGGVAQGAGHVTRRVGHQAGCPLRALQRPLAVRAGAPPHLGVALHKGAHHVAVVPLHSGSGSPGVNLTTRLAEQRPHQRGGRLDVAPGVAAPQAQDDGAVAEGGMGVAPPAGAAEAVSTPAADQVTC